MAHPAALRRRLPGDKRDHGFLKVLLYIFSGLFFGRSADFSDHDDAARFRIFVEQLERVDMPGADDRIAADSDATRLPDAKQGQLIDRFVSQRARSRDDADVARLVDVPGHDADFAFARGDDSRAVGTDEPRFAARQVGLHLHHVEHGYAFGDADDELDA